VGSERAREHFGNALAAAADEGEEAFEEAKVEKQLKCGSANQGAQSAAEPASVPQSSSALAPSSSSAALGFPFLIAATTNARSAAVSAATPAAARRGGALPKTRCERKESRERSSWDDAEGIRSRNT
jgi:hypothetical protein